ncbi:MAG: hypothetical protein MR761_00190 [Butyricicoccus porcorum]|nr:hypothetical protein [Butyricicoccus porcorum]
MYKRSSFYVILRADGGVVAVSEAAWQRRGTGTKYAAASYTGKRKNFGGA